MKVLTCTHLKLNSIYSWNLAVLCRWNSSENTVEMYLFNIVQYDFNRNDICEHVYALAVYYALGLGQ